MSPPSDTVASVLSVPDVEPTAVDPVSVAGQRIIIYGMNYAPEFTGVGRYTGEIGADLAARGADVRVITTPPHYPGWVVRDSHCSWWYQSEKLDGARVIRCPLLLRRNMGGIWRLIAPLSFAVASAPVALWQILRQRPNVVLCVEPTLFSAPLAILAARIVGAHTVLHVQDLEVDAAFAVGHLGSHPWLRRLAMAFERVTLLGFDRVITISKAMRERLADKGIAHDRLSIVRNWVDLDKIYPMDGPSPYRAELDIPLDTFVVQYSGNIGPKQALQVLLEVAELLKDRNDILFVVAGDGPSKAKLQRTYDHLANVRILGFQPEVRMCEFLNLADLHVLPQEVGTADLVLPSKLGGMLASGRAIVVTADAGTELADFVGEAAIVVPPGDAGELANVVARLAEEGDTSSRSALAAKLAGKLGRVEGLSAIVAEVDNGTGGVPRRLVPYREGPR